MVLYKLTDKNRDLIMSILTIKRMNRMHRKVRIMLNYLVLVILVAGDNGGSWFYRNTLCYSKSCFCLYIIGR